MKRAVAAVLAAVKSVVTRVAALVKFESAAKKSACSKVVCIKAAKNARKGVKRAKAPKTSKK